VLDFGIAKAAAEARPTEPGMARKSRVRGKLAYLSPEQLRNGDLDGRSDVFSLGVVLWEMLVGQRLFAGGNEFETMRNVLTAPVPPPSSKREGVPAVLDAVVLRALARDRGERLPSAAAFASAVEAAMPSVTFPATEAAVGELLGTLFGDGDLGIGAGRFTSTFTAMSDSAQEVPVVETVAPAPPAGGKRPQRLIVLVAATVVVLVGLVVLLAR
jgi:hypothetical protein